MSIQQNFPAISPSLSLNFARSKTLDPRITFTRTSTATRVNGQGLIEGVPANTPRFDHSYDPVSGTVKSLGLLIEESRSNLVLFSERSDLTCLLNVSGGNGLSFIDGETITASAGGGVGTYVAETSTSSQITAKLTSGFPAGVLTGSISGATRNINLFTSIGGYTHVSSSRTSETKSPDGQFNAFLVSPTTTETQLRTVSKTYTTSTAGTYTYSIFFKNKNISNNRVAIYIGNQTSLSNVVANFDLSTKSFGSGAGGNGGWTGSVGYQDYPNGWIKI